MEKTTITKKNKLISIACIIAILLAVYCQFVSGWNFTGTVTNPNTRETRAMDMEMSLAGFVWQPYTEEAIAFKNYVNDPSLDIYEEIIVNGNISEEEYDGVGMILGYDATQDKYATDGNNVAIATYELEDSSTRQIILDSSYNHDEAVEKAAAEAAEAGEAEAATEEAEEEEAPAVDPTATVENSNLMISVTTAAVDPVGDSQNTVLSKSVDKEAALTSYEEYTSSIGTASKEQAEFINGIVMIPALLLVFELLAIALIILKLRKGKGALFASIATAIFGVINLYYFYSQPIFMLFQEGSFSTIDTLLSIVTVLGFILIANSINYANLNKGLFRFTKNRTYVSLISGLVSTIVAILVSKVLFIGAASGISTLSFILGLVLLAYGILTLFKAIINALKDNANVKRASK